jgi:hypothetical protein
MRHGSQKLSKKYTRIKALNQGVYTILKPRGTKKTTLFIALSAGHKNGFRPRNESLQPYIIIIQFIFMVYYGVINTLSIHLRAAP